MRWARISTPVPPRVDVCEPTRERGVSRAGSCERDRGYGADLTASPPPLEMRRRRAPIPSTAAVLVHQTRSPTRGQRELVLLHSGPDPEHVGQPAIRVTGEV